MIPFIKLTTTNDQAVWLNPVAIHAIYASAEGGWLSIDWPDNAGCRLDLAGDWSQFVLETAEQVLNAIQTATKAERPADVDGGYF